MNTVSLSDKDMILYILNFIRYDVPILMAGKSSIGKSYTILEMAKQWGMPNAVLYVGSEKADNIEGLPKLIQSTQESLTSENVLEYYKPYWFPKTNLIQDAVRNGQEVFDTKIKPYFKNKTSDSLPFETVMGLLWSISNMKWIGNETTQTFYHTKFNPQTDNKNTQYNRFVDVTKYITPDDVEFLNTDVVLTRELVNKGEDFLKKRNELYELSLYLCTLVGLGNYWLVLDELDKVQPEEADKFAPMLHIVRERRLKTYSLREFNDGKGADVAMNVVGNSYLKIYNDIKNSLANNLSVLDTRIIGISNKTDNIIDISDALFKRFIQIVIDKIIKLKPVDAKLESIRECLSQIETSLEGQQGKLTLGYLDEINLQWQFGFLPRLMNTGDTSGNFIRNNFINDIADALNIVDKDMRQERINYIATNKTALGKMCKDNFNHEDIYKFMVNGVQIEETISQKVLECLIAQVDVAKQDVSDEVVSNPLDLINEKKKQGFDDKDTALEVYDVLMQKYQSLKSGESKTLEVEALIDYAFSFIQYTAYSDGYTKEKITKGEPYTPLKINEYLIPLIIKFVLKIVTKDENKTIGELSFDDKDRLLAHFSELWDSFIIPEHIDKIKGDEQLTNKLFYGGSDSLWGSSDLNADDFQNSFVNKYNVANAELFSDFIKGYLEMDADEQEEFKDFIEYIKKYRKDDVLEIKDSIVSALKKEKRGVDAVNVNRKFKDLFDI
jgi:hypothetical protein